jgi:cytochrome c oxidase assembly protein subunit 15
VHDKILFRLATVALIILLIQIVIGTEVREQVDEVSKSLNYEHRELWIDKLNFVFDIHKTFAVTTAVLVIFVCWQSLSHAVLQKWAALLLLIVLLLMAAGLTLSNLNIPAFIQPVHLLLSSILFVALFAFRLNLRK